MSKSVKITLRKRAVVVRQNEEGPFWLEHIILIVCVGVAVLIAGIVLLSLTDWGRATLTWLGIGAGVTLTACLLIDPVRSIRKGDPAVVCVGGVITAIGWGCVTISLLGGFPFLAWVGSQNVPEWAWSMPGAGSVAFTAVAGLGMWMLTRGPLPALDRTPRSARVVSNTNDAEGAQRITVHYSGADGDEHEAELADLIDGSWRNRFAPGTTWQVYAFQNPDLADAVVFLTEEHEDVWRSGYRLNGVRLGGEGGPVARGPGSPFLREGGKWRFES